MPIASSLLKKPRLVEKLRDFYNYVNKNDGKVGTKTRGIDLNFNNACNLRCKYCFTNSPKGDHVKEYLEVDKNVAIGIAAGYLNLTCSLLGYRTGCCQCFDVDGVQQAADLPTKPILLMGIGFNNPEMNRRRHQLRPDFMFPTKKKQEIKVAYWD